MTFRFQAEAGVPFTYGVSVFHLARNTYLFAWSIARVASRVSLRIGAVSRAIDRERVGAE
jgi:hypothetical protein